MSTDEALPPSEVFVAMLRRDIRVVRRELAFFLVRTLMQPLLFITTFGFLLPRMRLFPSSYTTTLLPGVLAISLALSAVQSVALPMVSAFGITREIEDRLLAPVPTRLVALELVFVGAVQGMIAAAVVLPLGRLIMGPIPGLDLSQVPELAGVTVLGAAVFSALGLWLGTAISAQHIGLMFSFIIAPMLFLGCAYYPWRGLDTVPVLQYVVLLNPLVYVSEGMRSAVTPSVPHMSPLAVFSALVLMLSFFWWRGLRTFERRAIG
ncbi:MAG TPA: ABC transporter permease [Gemmatimonadaceae bacterium]|nr:ABC transporter permease [Gemmatimonadaceae bacterium]